MNYKIDEKLVVNAIRLLAVCSITNAKSGHPGVALGAAPIMYELFANQMNISPINHKYFNRDRFILSCGHASALLYATMLVCGYNNITINDLKKFRQLGSKTAGHPEPKLLDNIEICTGPLGQGIAMSVGLAIASKKIANQVNTNKISLINNYTYCLFGDGCFQEGVSYEAIAIAGRLKLNNLIMIYDYNSIQLDGPVKNTTTTDVKKYFQSMGWNVIESNDNLKQISSAIKIAKMSKNKPSVILCHTTIGYGSDVANSNKSHGNPLTNEQILVLKKHLSYKYDDFIIPKQIRHLPNLINNRLQKEISSFNKKLLMLKKIDSKKYRYVLSLINNNFNFDINWFDSKKFPQKEATRNISGEVLQTLAKYNPNLLVSIADVSSSTKIIIKNSSLISSSDWNGQNLNCGVREFAMSCINNGIIAYGGLKSLGSTFMSFSDYNKAAIRLAAISEIPLINIYSHDSITVGEDGPTHQPIEQLWSLRLVPNHVVFRPTNYIDTIVAYEFALKSNTTPTSIITSRSAFNQINVDYKLAKHGAYVVYNSNKFKHKITIYASGSEIELAINAAKNLPFRSRVVAINSLELLNMQSKKYINMIFDNSKKVSIEFGSTTPWHKYIGDDGLAIGVDCFGYSGKANDVSKKLNLSQQQIINRIKKWYKTKGIN